MSEDGELIPETDAPEIVSRPKRGPAFPRLDHPHTLTLNALRRDHRLRDGGGGPQDLGRGHRGDDGGDRRPGGGVRLGPVGGQDVSPAHAEGGRAAGRRTAAVPNGRDGRRSHVWGDLR